MQYYKLADYDVHSQPCFKRHRLYDDNIYSFDIETTSLFVYDNNTQHNFDKNKSMEFYSDTDKYGFMYIWQFSINDRVYYGRTWQEFLEFCNALSGNVAGYKIVYVHNLAYEFQFLRNVVDDFEVFAREPRHPMVARSEKLMIEFRCSLMLTQTKLSNLTDMYSLPVKKLVGDLDYNKIRTEKTEMTEQELKYCENDCLVVYELIKKFKAAYKNVCSIPLTQTGILRKECQKIYKHDYKYHKKLRNESLNNIDDWTFCMKAFSGGYTHANHFYTGNVIRNVTSMDITSSYPTVMVSEKFPSSRFAPSSLQNFDDMVVDKLYIIDVTFNNIYAVTDNTYLSYSKLIDRFDCVTDNGRVEHASMARIIITNVDYEIIKQVYKYDSYKINSAMRADSDYLDSKFINKIIELYANKTAFKGLPDKSNEYMQAKQFINSMYGMMVTNLITDTTEYSDEWSTVKLTHDKAQEKLEKINNDHNTFLNQEWGIFVTAYARRNLWDMILKIDHDVIYCDTDSIKYIHDHSDIFKAYNNDIQIKIKTALEHAGIDPALSNPTDTKGIHHPLGVYDHDASYSSFITQGAKRYAYRENGNIGMTVAGVNKKTGVKAIKKLSDFTDGLIFDYDTAGKKLLTYRDDQPPLIVKDYQGHACMVNQKYGINMHDTQYTLGMSLDYMQLINNTQHYSGGGFEE